MQRPRPAITRLSSGSLKEPIWKIAKGSEYLVSRKERKKTRSSKQSLQSMIRNIWVTNMLPLQPDSIYEEKARGAFVRSRRKWLEEGEKNTKYFFSLEKRNVEMSALVKRNIHGQTAEEPDKIKHAVTQFYELLQEEKQPC